MSDRRETAAPPPGAAHGVTAPVPAFDTERVLLLECRLEQMRSALDGAREEADRARAKLAEAAAREADHARRAWRLHEDLSEARAEVAALHRRLEQSEALRAELAGHLFEAGDRDDAEELRRLRTRALAEDQRSLVLERTADRLRERVEELLGTRETLLTRITEWQVMIREDGPEALDLSEFLSDLRREILDLEHRANLGEARELHLRATLAGAGIDPDRAAGLSPDAETHEGVVAGLRTEAPDGAVAAPTGAAGEVEGTPAIARGEPSRPARAEAPAPATPVARAPEPEPERLREPAARAPARRPVPAPQPAPASDLDPLLEALFAAETPAGRAELLLRLGKSGDVRAAAAVGPWTASAESSVRAAAYEALGRLLERDPAALEPHVRAGLADTDARVRRRVALSAATSRHLEARPLLEPLMDDPDPQVRRVVREVLRQAPGRYRTSSPNGTGLSPGTPSDAHAAETDDATLAAAVTTPAAEASHPSVPTRSPRG